MGRELGSHDAMSCSTLCDEGVGLPGPVEGVALQGLALEFQRLEQRNVGADAAFAAADGVLEGKQMREIGGPEPRDTKIR